MHLLSEIQCGQFAPDAIRSGMLTPRPASAAMPRTPVCQQVQLKVTEDQRKQDEAPQVIHCKSSDEEAANDLGVQDVEF